MSKVTILLKLLFALFISNVVAAADIDFEIDQKVASVGMRLQFRAVSSIQSSDKTEYLWSFGDGEKSTSQLTTHTYSKSGSFIVALTVISGDQIQGTVSKNIEVVENVPPIAGFYVSHKEINVGDNVVFISQAQDLDKNIKTIAWSVKGDPTVNGEGSSFHYKFLKAGKYEITQIVTDSYGAKSQETKSIQVYEKNIKPDLEVEIPENIFSGEKTAIEIKAKDRDGKIEKILWQINGFPEQKASENKIYVVFPMEQDYRFIVRAIDNRGSETVVSKTVHPISKFEPPAIKLMTSANFTEVGKEIYFKATYDKDEAKLSKVFWDYGDGGSNITSSPESVHKFLKKGKFKVKATFEFAENVKVHLNVEIRVQEKQSSIRTLPTQVVINQNSYIELVPDYSVLLPWSVYSGNTKLSSYGTPVWSCSDCDKIQLLDNGYGIYGVRGRYPGTTKVKITIDGISSQEITINVLDNSVSAVIKSGRFIGSNINRYCHFINERVCYNPPSCTVVNYSFENNYIEGSKITTASGLGSPYAGSCFNVRQPDSKGEIVFKASGSGTSYQVNKTNPIFRGRNGFLRFLESNSDYSSIEIKYEDDRFVEWDKDFSITYWSTKNEGGLGVFPLIEGKYKFEGPTIVNSDYDVYVSVAGATQTSYLHEPSYNYDDGLLGYSSYTWIHTTYTFNASTRILKLYQNGDLLASVLVPSAQLSLTPRMRFVRKSLNNYSQASFDELRFWNKELTASEVENELFSPAAITSPNLLASFNFDSGKFKKSDNGSEWSYSFIGRGVREPVFQSGASKVLEAVFFNSFKTAEGNIYSGDFYGRKVSLTNQKLATSPTGVIIEAVNLFEYNSAYSQMLNNERVVSPFIFLSPLKNSGWTEAFPFGVMKIPINISGLSRNDLLKLKVAVLRPYFDTFLKTYFFPVEVNFTEGYVAFHVFEGGVYWISVKDTLLKNSLNERPSFSNSDLKASVFPSFGRRAFSVVVPNSVTSYNLSSETVNSEFTQITCVPSMQVVSVQGPLNFPIELSNLSIGENNCEINYKFKEGESEDGQPLYFWETDYITLKREG